MHERDDASGALRSETKTKRRVQQRNKKKMTNDVTRNCGSTAMVVRFLREATDVAFEESRS